MPDYKLRDLDAIFSYLRTFLSFSSLAGGTYTKVANAIKDLDYEITTDNAKGLGKGKTKVAGIGKGSAEKVGDYHDKNFLFINSSSNCH